LIALDTNLLVYAYRRDGAFYTGASRIVRALAEADQEWAIPWPCVHEFLAVVTSQRVYDPPSPIEHAIEQVLAWTESPRLVLLGEGTSHLASLVPAVRQMNATGIRIHHAKIAAICIAHGVSELWTVDRDFSRVEGLRTRNPLPGPGDAKGPPPDEGGPSLAD
jgi:hypothetical protein